LLLALTAACAQDVGPGGLPPAGPVAHLRTGVRSIGNAVSDGYRRSPTFRLIADQLRSANAVVYIEAGRCKPDAPQTLGGCLAPLAETAAVRYFRVVVDVGRTADQLIALIGHELQHAAELTSVPGVRQAGGEKTAAVNDIRTAARIYETAQAQAVSRAILTELRSNR
jgi:hypothetical protein